MFIHDYVKELKRNVVCWQHNMKDCADAVQRNKIDGCRFLVGSFLAQYWCFLFANGTFS